MTNFTVEQIAGLFEMSPAELAGRILTAHIPPECAGWDLEAWQKYAIWLRDHKLVPGQTVQWETFCEILRETPEGREALAFLDTAKSVLEKSQSELTAQEREMARVTCPEDLARLEALEAALDGVQRKIEAEKKETVSTQDPERQRRVY